MKTILQIFAFLLFVQSHAQQIEVYFAKGDVLLITQNKKQKVAEGTKVADGATLKIGKDAMLILLQDEKAVVLNEPGKYSYQQVSKQLANSQRSLTDRYISYIWNRAHKEADQRDDEGKGESKVKGMVTRGGSTILSPTDSITILENELPLTFAPSAMPAQLVFYKKSRPLFSVSVSRQNEVVKNSGLIKKGEWLGLCIESEMQPCAKIIYVKWATNAEIESIKNDYKKLDAEIAQWPEEVRVDLRKAFFELNRILPPRTM